MARRAARRPRGRAVRAARGRCASRTCASSVLELLTEAELALGQHAHLLERLERLVAEHPYRERFRAQLMLALYRCDRQADALQAYRDARRALADELGIEPGERLRELEQAILTQDPRLDLAPAAAPAAPEVHGGRVRRARARARRAHRRPRRRGRGPRAAVPARRRAGDRQEPARGGAEHAGPGARRAGARRPLLGGGRRARVLAVGAVAARVRPPRRGRSRCARSSGPGATDVAQLLPELRTVLPDLPPAPAVESEGARFRLFDSLTAFLQSAAADAAARARARRPARRRRALAAAAAVRGARARPQPDAGRRRLPRRRPDADRTAPRHARRARAGAGHAQAPARRA